MNIYILDDEQLHCKRLYEAIKNVKINKKFDGIEEVLYAQTASDMLKQLDNGTEPMIVFLDIHLGDDLMNGLDFSLELREKYKDLYIVFVSNASDYIPLLFQYKYGASGFIDKDLEVGLFQGRIESVLESIFSDYEDRLTKAFVDLPLRNVLETKRISISDVIYFETDSVSHRIIMFQKNRVSTLYSSLKKVEKVCPDFIRVHRSILINPDYIEGYDSKLHVLHLSGGYSCVVSRSKRKQIKTLLGVK